ncbi:heparanase [Entelurus aequoreus]|uniref:heparanase n=1 Tax=Entelurus aequoreus TaxID=161455 RepID=UPI002B1E19D6|nr:heparanase [Entelurus aequoreus]
MSIYIVTSACRAKGAWLQSDPVSRQTRRQKAPKVTMEAVEKTLLLLLLLALVVLCAPTGGTRARHRVDPRFVSVTIDASLAQDERFMYLLSSPKVRTLAKALAPAYVRFGGTRQDFMEFSPQRDRGMAVPKRNWAELPLCWEEHLKAQWRKQAKLLAQQDMNRKFPQIEFTEVTLDLLHAFANNSGLDLIFGLNALLRNADNTWNSSNARSLLGYCQSKRYRVSWELGNEPNSFEKKAGIRVDGVQLGEDFARLREMMSQSAWYRRAGLYGPDVGQPRHRTVDLLDRFLRSGSHAVDACTWHHYYVNGRDTSLDDFLDPKILDSLAPQIKHVMKASGLWRVSRGVLTPPGFPSAQEVRRTSPGKPVWLGETSSAYGGGAVGLSDTFAAGFMWLDKLGLAAKMGVAVVMRQVLLGSGTYHLLDDNLDPLPDYWLTLLHKSLVGRGVLSAAIFAETSGSRRVRLYLQCSATRRYAAGAVTLIAMNLGKMAAQVAVPTWLAASGVDAFVLQSDVEGEDGLLSRSVMLNGDLLKMAEGGTLPPLKGSRLPAAEHLQLPAFSLAFFVFTDAQHHACAA